MRSFAGGDSEWNVIHGYSYHSYNKAGPRMVEEVATLREKLTVRSYLHMRYADMALHGERLLSCRQNPLHAAILPRK